MRVYAKNLKIGDPYCSVNTRPLKDLMLWDVNQALQHCWREEDEPLNVIAKTDLFGGSVRFLLLGSDLSVHSTD